MKKTLTKLFRHNLKALMLVMMTSFFAFSATGQGTTVNSSTDGPYYPYQGFGADYEAAGFPAGTTYYLYVDINGNNMVDNEDVVLAQSTDAIDSIGGMLPNSLTDDSWDIEIAGTNGEDLPSPDALSSDNLAPGDFITQNGTSGSLVFDQDGPRNAITAMIDLDYDFVYFGVYVDADTISAPNEIVFSYSMDGGDNYVDLEDIGGLASLADTAGYFYYQLPQAALTDTTILRISQNSSGTLVGDLQAFQISGLDVYISDTESIQFGNDNVDNIYVDSPTFSFDNIVEADTVGEDFGTDYEAFGFTTGATFYMYTTQNLIFIDDEDYPILNGKIYDMSTAASGTFEGTFPLEEADNYQVRVAGVYGNLETPFVEFEDDEVTVLGSGDDGFDFYFDQNGVRSLRTNAVDLSAETVGVLYIDFDEDGSSYLEEDEMLRIQYSINNGSTWVNIDSIYDETPDGLYNFDIPAAAFTSAVQFRVRQVSIDNGEGNNWEVDEIYIQQFEVAADEEVDYFELNNWALVLNDVLNDEGGSIGNYGTLNPGDSITLELQAYGFDPADSAFVVYFDGDETDGKYLLDGQEVTVEDDMITIAGFVPKDIEYNDDDGLELIVRMYDAGASEVSFGSEYDLYYYLGNDDFDEEDFTLVGGAYDGSDIEFEAAGDRSFTTPAIAVSSLDGLTLDFYLERLNNVRSSAGTEVVFEYSTDGSTYTIIETYSLNEFGTDGETYEFYGTDLPAGIVSASTSFRWRQLSNSGSGLDTWYLYEPTIEWDNNIVDLDYLDYPDNYDEEVYMYINTPSLSIGEVVDGGADLYPGTEFTVDFEIEGGEFPDGTEVTLYLYREGFPIILDTQDAAATGTFTAEVPSIIPDVYTLWASTSYGDVDTGEGGSLLAVIGVQINEVDITSADAVQDGEDEVIYPGATVDISYNVVGAISSEVTATLLVWDNDEEEYVVLISGEDADGTISAELPLGINYGGDNNVEFQLQLVNGNLESVVEVFASDEWDDYYDDYDGITDDYGSYARFNEYLNYTESYFITNSWDLSELHSASILFNFEVSDYHSGDVPVLVQYTLDEGETWVTIAEQLLDSDAYENGLLDEFTEIPEEAMTEETQFRWIFNEGGEFNEYYAAIDFYGFELRAIELEPISEAEFDLNDFDIYMIPLTISMANLEEAEYQLGEEFSVTYNADGPFASNVTYAVVLSQETYTLVPSEGISESDEYVVLGEADASGIQNLTVNFPSYIFGDPEESYEISIEPYIKAFDDDVFRPFAFETDLDPAEDFEFEGGYILEIDDQYMEFKEVGERYALTRALDLTATDTATLEFSFEYFGSEPSTNLSLPILQVSIDGGATFETIDVEGSDFAPLGYLYWSDDYYVGIPSEYLTEATHFRWYQALNRGYDQNKWKVGSISITEGTGNALSSSLYDRGPFNPQTVYALIPDLDDFVWEQSDPNDAVFNGGNFEYLWTIDSTVLESTTFPEGTEFIFTLSGVTDPSTDEDLVIATTSEYGVGEATIPYYVENDNYSVEVTAYVMIDDEPYYFFEEEGVGSLDIFNRAIQLTSDADQGTILYAGSTVTFGIEVENETSALDTENLYANLIWDGWLLTSQQGLGDITIDLPSFISGDNVTFEIEVTEGGPLGEDLTELEDNELDDLEEDEDNFINKSYVSFGHGISFNDVNGLRVLTTRDFVEGELENTTLLSFDLNFSFDELLEVQNLIFEYSIDGGATYTTLETFADNSEDEEGPGYNDTFNYVVSDEMKENTTRFRWRQDESEGDINIDNISLNYAEALPFDYASASLKIKKQALIITSVDQTESCYDGDITINYEIRGRFGADNMVYVAWNDESDTVTLEGFEFAITEGTGSVVVQVAGDLIDDDQFDASAKNNMDFAFWLQAGDSTYYDDLEQGFEVWSVVSEDVEVVAPITKNGDLGFSTSDVTECEATNGAFATISKPQNYFLYEIINTADGTVMGSLEYDPDEGNAEVELGVLTADVNVQLRVTSRTSTGTTCNVYTFDGDKDVKVLPNYSLFRDRYTTTGTIEVATGETKTICEGDLNTIGLSLRRGDGSSLNANDASVEWFRDNFDNSVKATGTYFGDTDGEITVSGSYFARITDGDCSYLTESLVVTVLEQAEQPEITIVSNDLSCGEGTAVLSAPEGYAYYKWSNGMTSQMITLEEGGSFSVQVSNYPFGTEGSCGSPASETVVIEVGQFVEIMSDYEHDIEVTACGSWEFEVYADGDFDGVLTLYKDGAEYEKLDSDDDDHTFEITESGVYYATWSSWEIDNTCTSMTSEITVTINEEIEETPVITASGDISFCEGGSVTLSAPAGYPFYRWFNDGTVVGSGETLEVAEDGEYEVRVSNVAFGNGCGSPYSEVVEVTVYEEQDLMIGYVNNNSASYQYEEGDEIEVCSSDNFTLWVNNETTSGATYTWYRDGVAIPNANSTSRKVTASGTFYAEVTYGVDDLELAAPCVYTTPSVVVNFNQKPAAVRIAEPANVDFCAGEINLTLTADAGAAFYNWYHNGSLMFDEPSTSNTLMINDGGTYSVTVENGDIGCESARSNIITIDERAKANPNITVYTDGSDCATGDVTVILSSTNSSTVYQLINRETGADIGSPVVGSSGTNVYTTLSGLTEPVALLVEASYSDGSGCSDVSSAARGTATPNGVILVLDGTEITAEVSATGSYELSWYRNGTLMRNATGNTINVVDAATYSVEVTFDDGCTVTSSTVDVGAGAPAAGRTASNGRIVANTFPNPSTDFVNVEVPGEHFGVYQVQIMTLSGQVVISGEFTKEQESYVERIDISNLEKGIYNMMVVKGKQVENIRIVKQ
ncbi:MAG: T9SS type A sorting domain-containing protein [Marinoscillum sp.]|uniref:T9SS type A sorting domain-containing protein n=1 Tax=Marinoscillum sp. TaxID=2024838 RepID=UPI0033017BE5